MVRRHLRTSYRDGQGNWPTLLGVSFQAILLGSLGSCTCVGPFFRTFTVRGLILSADTDEPRAGEFISIALLRDGEVVGRSTTSPASRGVAARSPLLLVTGTDGSFAIVMGSDERAGCLAGLLDTPTAKDPVIPDQVRIVILGNVCEQAFLIDLTEDTVVDISFPDRVIELIDPILVPPCEE